MADSPQLPARSAAQCCLVVLLSCRVVSSCSMLAQSLKRFTPQHKSDAEVARPKPPLALHVVR